MIEKGSDSGLRCRRLGRRLRECRRGEDEHQQYGPRRLHQHLRRGARADRELAVVSAQPDAVGGGVALLDLDDLSRLEIVALDEAQELAVLIADAPDRDRFVRADRSAACRTAGG